MAKMGLDFEGMDQMVERLSRMGLSTEKAASSALEKTHAVVTKHVDEAQRSSRYNLLPGKTGMTAQSVHRDPTVGWAGPVASVGVGWSIADGGLPSVFLMYGTPSIAPDRTLYNAVFGRKTRDEVRKKQAEAMAGFLVDGRVR